MRRGVNQAAGSCATACSSACTSTPCRRCTSSSTAHRTCRRHERLIAKASRRAQKKTSRERARTRVQRRPVHGCCCSTNAGSDQQRCAAEGKWLLRAEKAATPARSIAGHRRAAAVASARRRSQPASARRRQDLRGDGAAGCQDRHRRRRGEVIEERPVPAITADRLAQVAAQFTGALRQVPPMHSALKKDGKPCRICRPARKSSARRATWWCTNCGWCRTPSAIRRTRSGWRPRSARAPTSARWREIGEAWVAAATSRRCGASRPPVRHSQCVTLDALEGMTEAQRLACLKPVGSLLPEHEHVSSIPKTQAGS